MRYVRAAALSDLPAGGRLALRIEGRAIVLFNVDGSIYAIDDRCPHQLAPLNDGTLEGTRLICSWHGWTFELDPAKPGAHLPPAVRRHEVKIESGAIYLALAAETRAGSSSGASIQ